MAASSSSNCSRWPWRISAATVARCAMSPPGRPSKIGKSGVAWRAPEMWICASTRSCAGVGFIASVCTACTTSNLEVLIAGGGLGRARGVIVGCQREGRPLRVEGAALEGGALDGATVLRSLRGGLVFGGGRTRDVMSPHGADGGVARDAWDVVHGSDDVGGAVFQ